MYDFGRLIESFTAMAYTQFGGKEDADIDTTLQNTIEAGDCTELYIPSLEGTASNDTSN